VQKNEAVELESSVLPGGAEHLRVPSILKENTETAVSHHLAGSLKH